MVIKINIMGYEGVRLDIFLATYLKKKILVSLSVLIIL